MPSQNIAFAQPSAARTVEIPAWLATVIVGTAIFGIKALILIQHSLVNGRLSAPLTDDDVTYLTDALHRMGTLRSLGVGPAIWEFIATPPHSPISTMIGAVAFCLSNSASFAPYLVNGLILGAAIAMFVHCLDSALWLRVGLLFCAAWLPLSDWAIMTFRPDIMAGIVTAAVCGALLLSNLRTTTLFVAASFGIFGGLCLLYKPTAAPATAVLLITAASIAVLKAWPDKPRIRSSLAIMAAAGLLTSLPYFVPAARDLIDYVSFAMLQNTSITGIPGDALTQALFYPTQVRHLLGPAAVLLLPSLALVALLYRQDRTTLLTTIGFLAIVLVAYAIPTLPSVKTVMFGAYFYAASLVTFLFAVGMIGRRFPGLTAIAIAGFVATQAAGHQDEPPVYPPFVRVFRAIVQQTDAAIAAQSSRGDVKFYIGFPWPLGHGVIDLKALQEKKPYWISGMPDPLKGYFRETLKPYLDDIDRADIVLIPSPLIVSQFSQRIPAEKFLAPSLDYLRTNPRFELISTIATEWGDAYVFRNRAPHI
jgi:hypothetical protein